jgi:glycosyltransferase involved in cell wall biosynthesis
MILHFIQDMATPHNNALLRALREHPEVDLRLWYAHERHPQYKWTEDLTNAVQQAVVYGNDRLHGRLLRACLLDRQARIFLVGWTNATTRSLVILSWLLRRPYNMWFDYPQDEHQRAWPKAKARELFYALLLRSRATVFCTGSNTVEYFLKRGFPRERLVNLPIYNEVSKGKEAYLGRKAELFEKYDISEQDFFVTCGSRLVREKGFDLMFDAVAMLPADVRTHLKLLIVGKGPERESLKEQVRKLGLDAQIVFEDWLDIEDFRACIANSHLFVHPARFDAYGAGTLNAMIVGTPVVATQQSGSGPDRIRDGVNGFLYDCNDVRRLSEVIESGFRDRGRLQDMGRAARATAEQFAPEQGAQTLLARIQ